MPNQINRVLTEREEIIRWAESRGARPACVRDGSYIDDVGMIRFDFPDYSGRESLKRISWDEWFERFEKENLALVVEDQTPAGSTSDFNQLANREVVG